MSSRKQFLAAAAAVPLLAAAPAPPVAPAPTPTPAKRKTSQLARDFAERMREFDPSLSDKQLEAIAGGIDDNLKIGSRINPKGEALKNWDEPATSFEVPS